MSHQAPSLERSLSTSFGRPPRYVLPNDQLTYFISFFSNVLINKSHKQGKSASRAWIGTGNEGGIKKVSVDAGSTIEELMQAKKRAIDNEDFAEAQRLNEEIKAQQSTPQVSINDLMAARACAIAQEDFAEAQKIQAQINTLKQQQKGEAIGSAMATPRADVFSSNIGSMPSSSRPTDEQLTQGGSGSVCAFYSY